jgi:hypothetical protein
MESGTFRILLADDFKGWHAQVESLLQVRPKWQIVCHVFDGHEAVEKPQSYAPM